MHNVIEEYKELNSNKSNELNTRCTLHIIEEDKEPNSKGNKESNTFCTQDLAEEEEESNSRGSNESNTISKEYTVSNNNNESRIIMDTIIKENGKSKSAKVYNGHKEKNFKYFSYEMK